MFDHMKNLKTEPNEMMIQGRGDKTRKLKGVSYDCN